MYAWSTSMLLLLHSAFMLSVVKMLLKGGLEAMYEGHMLLNTSHVEIFSILCIQLVLCMGYPFMK